MSKPEYEPPLFLTKEGMEEWNRREEARKRIANKIEELSGHTGCTRCNFCGKEYYSSMFNYCPHHTR